MKPSGKYNWDNDFWVGQGIRGLGKQELNRRVKQQNALAAKAFKAAGGGTKESLTAKDVANVYRGFYHKELAKSMKVMADYDRYGMYMKRNQRNKFALAILCSSSFLNPLVLCTLHYYLLCLPS